MVIIVSGCRKCFTHTHTHTHTHAHTHTHTHTHTQDMGIIVSGRRKCLGSFLGFSTTLYLFLVYKYGYIWVYGTGEWVYMGIWDIWEFLSVSPTNIDDSSRTPGIRVYMGVYGCIWVYMGINGCIWVYMGCVRNCWEFLNISTPLHVQLVYGYTWVYMDVYGMCRNCWKFLMKISTTLHVVLVYKYVWVYMDVYGMCRNCRKLLIKISTTLHVQLVCGYIYGCIKVCMGCVGIVGSFSLKSRRLFAYFCYMGIHGRMGYRVA